MSLDSETNMHIAAIVDDELRKIVESTTAKLRAHWDAGEKPKTYLDDQRVQAAEDARRIFEASIDPKFAWASFDNAELLRQRVKRADNIVRSGDVTPTMRLTLQGPSGRGKTSLAIAYLRKAFDALVAADPMHALGTRFVAAHELGVARAEYPLGQGTPPLLEACFTAPLLLIDDIGNEPNPRQGGVSEVIDRRYNANLPTWFTTGFTAEELETKYGDNRVRRAVEGSRIIDFFDSRRAA